MVSFVRTGRSIRWIGLISGTIFLGAIGSGVWEKLLRPVSESFANGVLSILASLFHGYVDILHRDIGKAYHDTLSVAPYAALLTFAIFFPAFTAIYALRITRRLQRELDEEEKQEEDLRTRFEKRIRRLRRLVLFVFIPIGVLNLALYCATTLQDMYTRRTCNYVERCIDILAPDLTPAEVLRLRAEYRAVASAAAFYKLDQHLRSLASSKHVSLPEFHPIR